MEAQGVAQDPGPEQANPRTSVGETLAAARRSLGLSVDDVAQQLKFAPRQIESLEQGRFDRLPTGTFARGMVRAYARLLKTDPEPLLAGIPQSAAARPQDAEAVVYRKPIPFSDTTRRVNLAYASLSIAVLAVVAAVAWEWYQERTAQSRLTFVPAAQAPLEPARAPAKAVAPVKPVAPATPVAAVTPVAAAGAPLTTTEPPASGEAASPAAAEGMRRIVLRFERESWVEIRDRDGRALLSQLNPAGSERFVQGRAPFEVVIGNAQHVRLAYDGRVVDLMPYVKVEVARFTLE